MGIMPDDPRRPSSLDLAAALANEGPQELATVHLLSDAQLDQLIKAVAASDGPRRGQALAFLMIQKDARS